MNRIPIDRTPNWEERMWQVASSLFLKVATHLEDREIEKWAKACVKESLDFVEIYKDMTYKERNLYT